MSLLIINNWYYTSYLMFLGFWGCWGLVRVLPADPTGGRLSIVSQRAYTVRLSRSA
jgi:hypothetical protein